MFKLFYNWDLRVWKTASIGDSALMGETQLDRKPGQITSKMNLKLIFGQGSGFHPIRAGIWENFRDLVARLSILTDRQID